MKKINLIFLILVASANSIFAMENNLDTQKNKDQGEKQEIIPHANLEDISAEILIEISTHIDPAYVGTLETLRKFEKISKKLRKLTYSPIIKTKITKLIDDDLIKELNVSFIRKFKITRVLELIKLGANANIKNKDGDTPLLCVINARCPDFVISGLLEKKADINFNNNEITPLILAVRNECAPQVDTLIKSGAIIDYPNCEGETTLMAACELPNPNLARILINAGANINAHDKLGYTPLMILARNLAKNHFPVEEVIDFINYLIDNKVNINFKNELKKNGARLRH